MEKTQETEQESAPNRARGNAGAVDSQEAPKQAKTHQKWGSNALKYRPRLAIKLFCWQCMGGSFREVERCGSPGCPLRPFAGGRRRAQPTWAWAQGVHMFEELPISIKNKLRKCLEG